MGLSARPFAWLRPKVAWFSLTAAMVLAIVPFERTLRAAYVASFTPLGRDQGIFQYVAWAVRRGAIDYRDIRDVNGPLTHIIHVGFQGIGGTDEHTFHVFDLAISALCFGFIGCTLPLLGARQGSHGGNEPEADGVGGVRSASSRVARVSSLLAVGPCAAWGVAAIVILMGQYLRYLYWDLAQRESICDWFLLVGIGALLVAQTRSARGQVPASAEANPDHLSTSEVNAPASRRLNRPLDFGMGPLRSLCLIASGLCFGLVPFGKHTYAFFAAPAILSLLLEPVAPTPRADSDSTRVASTWARLRLRLLARETVHSLALFAVGLVLGVMAIAGYLAAFGSFRAFVQSYFLDIYSYRFIWPRTPMDILTLDWAKGVVVPSLLTTTLMLLLVALGQLPRRAITIALVPTLAMVGIVLQRKGFPYHFHPLSLGLYLQVLVLAHWGATHRGIFVRVAGVVATCALAALGNFIMLGSPHLLNVWATELGKTKELRESRTYLDHYRDHDFFPYELRQGAAFLSANLAPHERVQTYGMDPYLLFLAKRLSATPYIYAYDLNADAAAGGAWELLPESESPAVIARIRGDEQAHSADLLARLQAAPPRAYVFVDKAPLTSYEDALEDLEAHHATLAQWIRKHYEQTVSFGEVHIWLRR